MALEPEFLKQLIEMFRTELDEKLQIITDGLLLLEKNKEGINPTIIEEIFRAAHNIKGSAHSIGATKVGEIAHEIESIFTDLRQQKKRITSEIITNCFHYVDAMRLAMHSFSKSPYSPKDNVPSRESIALTPITTLESNNSSGSSETNKYETIRVALDQINVVSTLVEQMQINKIAIEDLYFELSKFVANSKELSSQVMGSSEQMAPLYHLACQLCKNMRNKVNELDITVNSLQNEVRLLRLVPASTVLRHLTRTVRDMAQELNKSIEFEITGDSVKLDKTILEGLKDPITHLLRNAIDHGIESPEIRKKNGKSEAGKITIQIVEEGNQILIDIKDDGAGIDSKVIAQTALKKHNMTHTVLDLMTESNLLELIFLPEFSTKEVINEISGRGIGLDVVRQNVKDLKGTVTVTTQKGMGTSFHLRLPLTLSSDRGLSIKSAGQLFFIPINAIEHLMTIDVSDIHEVEASQIILFNKKPVSLFTLSDLLNLTPPTKVLPERLPVVVLKKDWHFMALVVEDIIGEREIVIKPLQPPLNHVPSVVGGTLSMTGEVIIVLDPISLINQALQLDNINRIKISSKGLTERACHPILLVDDSITTRTLEKNILETNNYQVTVAVDGKDALDLLQKHTFSLVITDVDMPNLNGFELTKHIKKSDRLKDIPVIIVTSQDSEAHKKLGVDAGADAYIVKHQFESTELLEIVGQLV